MSITNSEKKTTLGHCHFRYYFMNAVNKNTFLSGEFFSKVISTASAMNLGVLSSTYIRLSVDSLSAGNSVVRQPVIKCPAPHLSSGH